MKHVLYGTTALVAAGLLAGGATALVGAGLLAGGAQAAEGVKLSVGGYYKGAMGAVISEDFGQGFVEDNFRDHAFVQDIEIHFKGETVLDNGITIGARVELEGEHRNFDRPWIDAAYAYASGGFGELRFGNFVEAGATLAYCIPAAGSLFGVDTPFFSFSNAGTNSTCPGLELAAGAGNDKATKIMYTSPAFGPLTFAVSYSPEQLEGDHVTRFDNNDSQLEDVISVGVQFAHDFNGFNVVVGGAGSWADYEDIDEEGDDPSWYNGYVNLSFSGFTLGGNFSYTTNYVDYAEADKLVYGAGVTYNVDAWTVGLGWSHGEYEIAGEGLDPDDNEDELDIIQLTGSYALGPGIAIDAMVGYNDFEDDAFSGAASAGTSSSAGDYDSFEVGLGVSINF